MPALYIVATPIGNLEDITLRAIDTLRDVKLIAAEDTRTTRKLLAAYQIKTPVTSYHEHNKLRKLKYLIGRLEIEDVALVSDAGMPGISDPGYELIGAAVEHRISVVPIPGPSVIITALAVSGLPATTFSFLGFLPHKAGDRKRFLMSVAKERKTLVMFESPHRLATSLDEILNVLGDRKISVCRELTKLHEEVFRGRVSQAREHFKTPRGEFCIVIEGAAEKVQPAMTDKLRGKLRNLRRYGMSAKDAVSQVAAETGMSKKELYQTWIKIQE